MRNLRWPGTLRVLQLALQPLGIRGWCPADLAAVAGARCLLDFVPDARRSILRCIVDSLRERAACHECSDCGCKQEFPGHADSDTFNRPSQIDNEGQVKRFRI
jgi:hypothetical protein